MRYFIQTGMMRVPLMPVFLYLIYKKSDDQRIDFN